jgi:AcrR family transcriptional regulator
MAWQRARQPEQKEQRRRAILDAAAGLLPEHDYDAVSMRAIAEHAGLAKGNLYRYFASKEALFLALYLRGLESWCDGLAAALAPLADRDDPDLTAAAIAHVVADDPDQLALQSLVAGVLERNLPEAELIRYKESLPPLLERLVVPLRRAVPSLSVRGAYQFYRLLYALLSGLWPMASPAPDLDRILRRPRLANLRVEFEPTLTLALRHLLRGLTDEGDPT